MTQNGSHPTDLELKNAVCAELAFTPSIDGAHIGVYVIDGSVTLSGGVHTYPEKLLAEKAAQRVRGVTSVTQQITVNAIRHHVEDSELVQEVHESLERDVDVPKSLSAAVKDGVITLSGEVQWQFERESAIRAVRYLRGVVAVHSQITIEPSPTAADLDAAITNALVRSAQLEGTKITVTTDRRGLVTLTGAVDSWSDRRQAEHLLGRLGRHQRRQPAVANELNYSKPLPKGSAPAFDPGFRSGSRKEPCPLEEAPMHPHPGAGTHHTTIAV